MKHPPSGTERLTTVYASYYSIKRAFVLFAAWHLLVISVVPLALKTESPLGIRIPVAVTWLSCATILMLLGGGLAKFHRIASVGLASYAITLMILGQLANNVGYMYVYLMYCGFALLASLSAVTSWKTVR